MQQYTRKPRDTEVFQKTQRYRSILENLEIQKDTRKSGNTEKYTRKPRDKVVYQET